MGCAAGAGGAGCLTVKDGVQVQIRVPTFRCLNFGSYICLCVEAHPVVSADFSV